MEKMFKAKRIDNGEWYQFTLSSLLLACYCYSDVRVKDEYKIDEDTICEYTGINDSEGNRIFEGDQLDFDPVEWGGPNKFYVKYDKFNAEFTGSGTPQNWTQFCTLTGHNIHDKD